MVAATVVMQGVVRHLSVGTPTEPSLALSSLSGVPLCADHSGDNDCGYVSELAIWMQPSTSGMLCVSVCTGPSVLFSLTLSMCVTRGSLVPVYVTLCARC